MTGRKSRKIEVLGTSHGILAHSKNRKFISFGEISEYNCWILYSSSIFNFSRSQVVFSIVNAPIYIPAAAHKASHFSTYLPEFTSFLNDSPSNRCDELELSAFNLHIPDD